MEHKGKQMRDFSALDRLLESLQERAKEFNCLCRVEEILSKHDQPLADICPGIVRAIPAACRYPDLCQVGVKLGETAFTTDAFVETDLSFTVDIAVQDMIFGTLTVSYTGPAPKADHGPFFNDEAKLFQTIAGRLGQFILHQNMHRVIAGWETAKQDTSHRQRGGWQVILEMLEHTDRELYLKIARKMLYHLCWKGAAGADRLLQTFCADQTAALERLGAGWNHPAPQRAPSLSVEFGREVFAFAAKYLGDDDILAQVQKWIQEDKLAFLVQVVNRNLTMAEVADAIRRYYHLVHAEPPVFSPSRRGIQVSLIRRFLSDQKQYVNAAKDRIDLRNFLELIDRTIFAADSQGRLGGKSAGLYLAQQIIKTKSSDHPLLADIAFPKTWYMTSDLLPHFMHYNNLDDVIEQKYKEIAQIRLEYPHIVQTFKSAMFPDELLRGLSMALDDFGEGPLIVRSSSLLEDRFGAGFSGMYKSLFVANRGDKQQRLAALTEAIAEVYASTFSPDPIEYRADRELIDFGEEMGIMIQQAVGALAGRYFLPAFAGVAFSANESRWSAELRSKDGLVRLVPGLGTRAVGRLSDDAAVVLAPGRPDLRLQAAADRSAGQTFGFIDLINLETNRVESVPLESFLSEVGGAYPMRDQVMSVIGDATNPGAGENLAVTFEGLINRTPFLQTMQSLLRTLEETLAHPVAVEFAHDGRRLYLLQCRAQSVSAKRGKAPIPPHLPHERLLFSAKRMVCGGPVPEISHVVYVDPERYRQLCERSEVPNLIRVISRLNHLLPRRRFMLIGPHRWGGRGNAEGGIPVGYSDINHVGLLVEVAPRDAGFGPQLAVGTNFFQNLVEAGIGYVAVSSSDSDDLFREELFRGFPNMLLDLLEESTLPPDAIRVIDVPQNTGGRILRVVMHPEKNRAVGFLTEPAKEIEFPDDID